MNCLLLAVSVLLQTAWATCTPSMVVVDLDYCLWRRPRFKSSAFSASGDGGVISGWCAHSSSKPRPASSCVDLVFEPLCLHSGRTLHLYDGASAALSRLADANVPVAAVSRTHRPKWALEWLNLLQLDDERTASDVIALVVMRDGVKSLHVRSRRYRNSRYSPHPPCTWPHEPALRYVF